MIRKLKIKFVCITMAIVTALLCVIFGLILHFTKADLETRSVQALQSIASAPHIPGGPGQRPGDARLPYFSLLIGLKGEILDVQSGNYDLSDPDMLSGIVKAALSRQSQTGVLTEYGLRFYKVSTPREQRLVFTDISADEAMLRGLVRTCALTGIACLLLFLGASLLLARWAIRPVEQAWQQQRQFVADASHELKTPLTVILTDAELLQSTEYSDTDKRRFAGSILTMSRQMRGLVEGLLTLARADAGSTVAQFSSIDLSGVVTDAVLPFEPVYFEKGLLLQWDIPQALRVNGCAEQLRQVVDILLDNAAKYSLSGGAVTVTLKKQNKHCLLSVANPGAALSREELQDIFKRFYRADKARAMDQSYGLGLSIAQRIVTEHKGRIWAQSENGINTFFVQLPAQ